MQTRNLLGRAILLATAFATVGYAYGNEEQTDRIVDQASVDTQSDAERDLARMAVKYQNTAKEAALLLSLSELRLEIADTLFRVKYGPGEGKMKAGYHATLARAVVSLSRLVNLGPKNEEYARALFLRGKAQRALKLSKPAAQDLEAFLARYPNREEASLAAIGIADIAIEQNRFDRAISVLAKIATQPSHPFFMHALQKRAWSYHVSGNSIRAAQELNLLAKHFAQNASHLTSAQKAVFESSIADVAPIAYSAFRQDGAKFTLNDVNRLLRSFDQGEGYHRMAGQVAERLRAADLGSELTAWKGIVTSSDPTKTASLGILVGILEYNLEREAFAEAVTVARDIAPVVAKNPQAESVSEAKKLVLMLADRLTRRITDYKKSVKNPEAEKNLLALLPALDQILGQTDYRIYVIRWNLAETLFALDRFEASAQTYRWIQSNWNDSAKASENVKTLSISKLQAAVKAIAARYESLRKAGVIPQKLEVAAAPKSRLNAGQLTSLREWISWIDELSTSSESQLPHFRFEANRALYQAGFADEAMSRSRDLALANPGSTVAMPSASLVIDTWIARRNWDQVEGMASQFAGVKGWTSQAFAAKMADQASKARFKRAESAFAAKNYSEALKHAEEFLDAYPKSALALDAHGISCNSLLKLEQTDRAISCLSSLVSEHPKSDAAKEAVRSMAKIDDDRYHFSGAVSHYRRYLSLMGPKLSKAEATSVKKRMLSLSRASGDAALIRLVSSDRSICVAALTQDCQENLAVAGLLSGANRKQSVDRAMNAPKQLRALYATMALENWENQSAQTQFRLLTALSKHWKDASVSVRYLLIPRLTTVIPELLQAQREDLRDGKLAATEKSVLSRIRAIEIWEKNAALVGTLPFDVVRLAAIEQSFLAYSDLVADLKELPAPKGANQYQLKEHQNLIGQMTYPFVLKSKKLKNQYSALELRQKAAYDADDFEVVFQQSAKPALSSQWAKAIGSQDWSRVAFFAEEAAQVKGLPMAWVKTARAVSLARSGAEAEANVLFTDVCKNPSQVMELRGVCRSAASTKKGRG